MALSLAIAFTVTPWLALKLMKPHDALGDARRTARTRPAGMAGQLQRLFAAPADARSWTARASAGCCWPASSSR